MLSLSEHILQARRGFLTSSASGLGTLAVASLLRDEALRAANPVADASGSLAPRPPHFAPRAKACICIYLEGGPSQIDLFDPKPRLKALDGQPLPESMTKNVRFAFLQKATARILASPRKFSRHGKCGMELSELLPHLSKCADDIALIRSMHTDAFNHHPGQLMMNTGVATFGRPSMGSWLTYGLGSVSKDLPGYVVLTSGRGTSGGASNWSSGFLPTTYQGVLFRNKGEPVLNLANPKGLSTAMQAKSIEAIRDLNRERHGILGDPEIASRIAAYELAFRMQSSAPELIDLSKEPKALRDEYGLDRPDAGTQGQSRRRQGAIPLIRLQLPFGPAAGRARRALRQLVSLLVGPPQRTGAGIGVQLLDGGQADRRARSGSQAARLARYNAGDLVVGVRADPAGREPTRLQGGVGTGPSSVRVQHLDGRRRHQGRRGRRQDRRARLEGGRGSRSRQRLPCHPAAPVRAGPSEADLPLPGPRLPPDRRRRQGGEEADCLSVKENPMRSWLLFVPGTSLLYALTDRLAAAEPAFRQSCPGASPAGTGKQGM